MRGYYDRGNCRQFMVLTLNSLIVRSSSRREGDGVKEVDGSIVILARYKFHFIREHENLV